MDAKLQICLQYLLPAMKQRLWKSAMQDKHDKYLISEIEKAQSLLREEKNAKK